MMATMKYEMPKDMMRTLGTLGNDYDTIVKDVLTEGVKPLEEAAKSSLTAVIGKGTKEPSESTGDLLKSLCVTKPYQTSNGDWTIKVGCAGYDRRGIPNPLKAAVLERGKSGQGAKPWAKPALAKSKDACIRKMQEALDGKVSHI